MPSSQGMQNVRHTPVELGEKQEPLSVSIQVDDASDKLYFHMRVLAVEHGDKDVVSIDSGTGLGGDFVVISYTDAKGKKHRGVCYMREIAREWIRQVDPKAPKQLLDQLTPERSVK